MSKKSIEQLLLLCQTNFKEMKDSIQNINQKCQQLEEKVDTLTTIVQTTNNNSEINTFTKIENKIEYLNTHFNKPKKYNTIFDFLDKSIQNIMKQRNDEIIKDIVQILKKNISLHDIIANYIQEINQMENEKWMFAFAFQKYTIYMWDHDKLSWDKMSQENMNKIFNIIHQYLLGMYSFLIQTNHCSIANIDLIEGSQQLYLDNFDRKYGEFKKMIFKSLI